MAPANSQKPLEASAGSNPLGMFRGGITGLDIGSPGTGKSHLLGTICELVPPTEVLLIAPKPREINSALYMKHGLDKTAQVFSDRRWRPTLGLHEAGGFVALNRAILDLYDDETYSVILVDPITDVVNLAAHDLMKGEKAATPRDMSDSRGYYGSLRYKMQEFIENLVGLADPSMKRPKHVFCAVHAQPAKDDEKSESMGVEFEGSVLPMIEGSFRQKIAGEFDMVMYSRIKHTQAVVAGKMQRNTQYVVQLAADNERHAKVSFLNLDVLKGRDFPNHLPTILQAVTGAKEEA